jgi:hypothetical protein
MEILTALLVLLLQLSAIQPHAQAALLMLIALQLLGVLTVLLRSLITIAMADLMQVI